MASLHINVNRSAGARSRIAAAAAAACFCPPLRADSIQAATDAIFEVLLRSSPGKAGG